MKKIVALILALSMMFALCACGHQHSWVEASCTEPKTCSECGKTEGEALGHDWQEATCTKAKTCSRCGLTEGKALGHKAGEASCTEAAICSVCGEVAAPALGHSWVEASCTEAKTCSRCGQKEGSALGHKWKDATVTKPKTCERCGETEGDPAILFYWNEPVDLGSGYTACFYDNGKGTYRFEISNPEESSATIYLLLKSNAFSDYGIGKKMYNWMNHVMTEHRDFKQNGKMVYYILNGAGGSNTFYFNNGDIDKEKNGLVGLELSYSIDSLYSGTIGTR